MAALVWFLAIGISLSYSQEPPSFPRLSLQPGSGSYTFLQESISRFYQAEVSVQDPPELSLLLYNPQWADIPNPPSTLLAIASRTNIPVDTLASLNRLESINQPVAFPILIPNQPGLFVSPSPKNDLEDMIHGRLAGDDRRSEGVELHIGPGTNSDYEGAWLFFPGARLTSSERLLLYQVYFSIPLRNYRITAPFGMDVNPFGEGTRYHHGIDLASDTDDLYVRASAGGRVSHVGVDPIYGLYLEIEHDGVFTTRYAHLEQVLVKKGQDVRTGDGVGIMGNTGLSTGRHLHFEIHKNGEVVNPAHFIRALRY